eukprot:scaffold9130_cov124-Isochrysis_galbana.AAC.5
MEQRQTVSHSTKRAHSELGWCGSKRAHECGEHHVALEGLADVLGAFRADFVLPKTARAKQRAITAVSQSERILASDGGEPSAHSRETVRAKQEAITHCQPLLTTKQAHSELGWWGSERAHERGEYLVALETLADVLGALIANTVGVKTVRAKQGAITAVGPC